jgi:hypothetical protein
MHMARPRLHNTKEEKAEAARAYKRAYYARYFTHFIVISLNDDTTVTAISYVRKKRRYTRGRKIGKIHTSRLDI